MFNWIVVAVTLYLIWGFTLGKASFKGKDYSVLDMMSFLLFWPIIIFSSALLILFGEDYQEVYYGQKRNYRCIL